MEKGRRGERQVFFFCLEITIVISSYRFQRGLPLLCIAALHNQGPGLQIFVKIISKNDRGPDGFNKKHITYLNALALFLLWFT